MKAFIAWAAICASAVIFVSGCGDPPHAKFKSACFKVIMDIAAYKGDMAADLEKAAQGSESWPAPLREKANEVIAQAKLFQDIKKQGIGGHAMINAAAEMGRSAGSFIDAAKKFE